MKELFQARTVTKAREMIAGYLDTKEHPMNLSLRDALGYRLKSAITAGEDIPGFNRSTMDGFAVRARDTFGASESLPAYLDITGEVLMGQEITGELGKGECWKIPTGGMLPGKADAVVMLEYTEDLDDKTIGVTRAVAPGENVVEKGEDVKKGDHILPAGHIIRPQDLGVLSALGIFEVEVLPPVRVGIISTGDEVVPADQEPAPGQVRDINSYALSGQVQACGGEPVLYGIAGDEYGELKEKLDKALDECDLVLLSGGSSVGTRDVASKVIEDTGSPGILFHGISIKPGKPTVGAMTGNKPVFGLPGHPVSAMVVFHLLVEPLVRYGEYRDDPLEYPVRAEITRNMRSSPGREDYIRVYLSEEDGRILAEPVMGRSGLISTMVRANGLAHIPAEKEGVEAGEMLAVKLL